MKKEIITDLQTYIDEHLKMQLICFSLSENCDKIGYPGFKHFFQVQAQDEMLHIRRIANYLLDRGEGYSFKPVEIEKIEHKDIVTILKEYLKRRTFFAEITDKFLINASKVNDFATIKFYEWFTIDFYEEIAETNDLINWLNMSNNNHYEVDKKALSRSEPNTLSVIDPFAPHS